MSRMRLTDLDRWKDPWFMGLAAELKLLWIYICDNIDNAAVWPVNKGLAEYQIGSQMDWGLAAECFGEHVTIIASGNKWFLHTVLVSQHPSGIDTTNKVHVNIRNLLMLHKIDQKAWPGGGLTGALQGPLPTHLTSPLPSQDSLGGSAEGDVAEPSALESKRERFVKFLTRLRLAHDADHVDEWIGFAKDCGATTLPLIESCIESVVRKARKDGVKVRFVSHVEQYGDGWKQWNEKRETEHPEKEAS